MDRKLIGIIFSVMIFLSAFFAQAAPFRTTYQAKIIKPDGQPLQASAVNFRFTILDPAASCALYVEDYTAINMNDTGGLVAFALGAGVRSFPTSGTAATFSAVFDNSTPSFACQTPGVYLPSSIDSRKIVMQFNDGTGWQTLPAMSINAVPYSMYASKSENSIQLNGKSDTAFVEYSSLAALNCQSNEAIHFNGVSFSCIVAGGGSVTSGSVITALGYTPADGASVTALSSSLSSTNSTVSSVSSTVFSVSSTVSSLAGSITSLQNSVAASFAAITSLQSLNGSTSGTQNFANGVTGNAPAFVTANGIHTLNIPYASVGTTTAGLISNTDYVNFNNKLSTLDLGGVSATGTLAIARLPSFIGDATIAAASNTIILANSGVTAGTYAKVTVDSKGRVTSGSQITSSDVTTALGYTPANSSTMVSSQWNTSGTTINYTNGNVGVGTTNPTMKLQVFASSPTNSAEAQLSLYGSETTGAVDTGGGVTFHGHDGSVAGRAWGSIQGKKENGTVGDVASYMALATRTSGQGLAEKVRITSTGNVGVGITTPVTKLDVSGGVRISMESATCAASYAGTLRYNTGNVEFCNGTTWSAFGVSGAGLQSFNGSTSGTQTFANGTAGNAPAFVTANGIHTLNIPYASVGTTTAGLISNADYVNFNNKLSTLDLGGVSATGTLAIARMPAFTGDATIAAASNTIVLSNSGVTAGTYTKVTVDSKGRVTSGSQLLSSDVTTALGYTPAASGSFTSSQWNTSGTTINYVAGDVGIGTTNPSYPLHVNGTVYSSSNISNMVVGTSGQQMEAGNSALTTLRFDSDAYRIFAGGTGEIVRITETGNVGIGTTNPTAWLHLAAGSASVAPFKFTSGTLLSSPQSGTMEYDGTNFYLTDSTNTRRAIAANTNPGTYDNVSNINSSGNITMTPTGSVIVSSTTASTNSNTGALVVKGGLGVAGNINTATNLNVSGSSVIDGSLKLSSMTSGSVLLAGVNGTVTQDNANFFWDGANKRLGIGTASPSGKLEVRLNNTTYNQLITRQSDFVDAVYLTTNSQPHKTALFLRGSDQIGGGLVSGREDNGLTWRTYLAFYTNNLTGTNTDDIQEKMRINADGYVGIGTTSPGSALSIKSSTANNTTGDGFTNLRLEYAGGYNAGDIGAGVTFAQQYVAPGTDAATIRVGGIFGVKTQATGNFGGGLAFFRQPAGAANMSEAMRIDQNGYVGIGSTAPIATLHVASGPTMTSGYSRNLALHAHHPTLQFKGISDTNHSAGIGYDAQSISEAMRFWVGATSDDISATGIQAMTITASGNVGIGTTAPAAKLDVVGDIKFTTASGSSAMMSNISNRDFDFQGNVAGNRVLTMHPGPLAGTGYSNIIVDFYGHNGTSTIPGFTMLRNGSIGIGTTSPGEKLHVSSGNILLDNAQYIKQKDDTGTVRAVLGTLSDGTVTLNGYHQNSVITAVNGATYFSGGSSTNMTILTGGNVGIGTNSPVRSLHVNGDAYINSVVGGQNNGAGNFHLDAWSSGADRSVYLNWSSGTGGAKVGNGSSNWGPISASAFNTSSDRRLKENIKPIENPLDKILKLDAVTFTWKDATRNKMEGVRLGLIAQNVEKIFPQAVRIDRGENTLPGGTKLVTYPDLVAPLIAAIKEFYSLWWSDSKELHKTIENQNREIASVKEENAQIKSDNAKIKKENEEIKARLEKLEKALSK